ncbi:tRNA-splicing endonuclease subunit Sen34p [Diutina catenulata]
MTLVLPVVSGSDVLVFSLEDVKRLRELGVCGVFIGTLAPYPQQNVFMSVPVRLSIWESLWLVQNGHAELVDYQQYRSDRPQTTTEQNTESNDGISHRIDDDEPKHDEATASKHVVSPLELARRFLAAYPDYSEAQFVTNYTSYCHLKDTHKLVIAPGLKFGGDLVCYPGDPLKFHAYTVVRFRTTSLTDIVVSGRLATSVKKSIVLIDDAEPEKATLEQVFAPRVKQAFTIEWAGFG